MDSSIHPESDSVSSPDPDWTCDTFLEAAEDGNLHVVERFMKCGDFPVDVEEEGIARAVNNGHADVVSVMISCKRDTPTIVKGEFLLDYAVRINVDKSILDMLVTNFRGLGKLLDLPKFTEQHTYLVKAFLKKGLNFYDNGEVYCKGVYFKTPLYVAVKKKFSEIVDIIVRNSKVDIRNRYNKMAFKYALAASKYGEDGEVYSMIAELLSKKGFKTEPADAAKDTDELMFVAIDAGNVAMVQDIKNGADVNKLLHVSDNCWYPSQEMPLHYAVKSNQIDIAKLLIGCGADVNGEDSFQRPPLFYAVSVRGKVNVELVKLLLNHKASVKGYPSLLACSAFLKEDRDILFDLLFMNGGDINTVDRACRTALHHSLESLDEDLVEYLLNIGANVNAQSVEGDTALHEVFKYYHYRHDPVRIVETLLKYNADVNIKDNLGRSPLHLCWKSRDFELNCKMLIENGADLEVKDNTGRTPLHNLISNTCLTSDEKLFLLQQNANVNTSDVNGVSILHICANYTGEEDSRVFEKLLEKGANVSTRTTGIDSSFPTPLKKDRYITPLHLAVLRRDSRNMCLSLLNQGADVNAQTESGLTPLHLMFYFFYSHTDHHLIIADLCEFGADFNIKCKNNKTAIEHNHFEGLKGVEYERSLGKQVTKLKLAGKYVDESYLNLYEWYSRQTDNITNETIDELESMKGEFLDFNTTLYDVFTKNKREQAYFERKANILEALNYDDLKLKFPHYIDLLRHSIDEGLVYMKALNVLSKHLALPYLCLTEIINYLRNSDLKNFIDACKQRVLTHESNEKRKLSEVKTVKRVRM